MTNLIGTDTNKRFFIVATDRDKHSVATLKKLDGKWNPEKKFWTIEIASLSGNYSAVRALVKYAGLEVKKSAAELLG